MPQISPRFYGIDVVMYFADHLPPHVHAFHGDDEALIEWDPAQVYRGSLPKKALKRVLEWVAIHTAALDTDWALAQARQPLNQIPPPP